MPGPETGPVHKMGTGAGSCSALGVLSPGSSSGLSEEPLILIGKVQGDKGASFRGNLEILANGSLHAKSTCQTSAAYVSVQAVPPVYISKGGGKTTGSKVVQALRIKPETDASNPGGIQQVPSAALGE